ncbi:MAG: hypothetical protein AB1640_15010 [bacterium]
MHTRLVMATFAAVLAAALSMPMAAHAKMNEPEWVRAEAADVRMEYEPPRTLVGTVSGDELLLDSTCTRYRLSGDLAPEVESSTGNWVAVTGWVDENYADCHATIKVTDYKHLAGQPLLVGWPEAAVPFEGCPATMLKPAC